MTHRGSWAVFAVLLAVTTAWAEDSGLKVGDVPPDSLGKDAEGDEVKISDHRGKVVVVSFFATWCEPCRKEIPMLARIQKAAGPERLTIVAVDFKEHRRAVRKARRLFKDCGLTFTHDSSGRIAKRFGVPGLPYMVIIGPDGRVAAKHFGYGKESLDTVIDDINRIYNRSRAARSR